MLKRTISSIFLIILVFLTIKFAPLRLFALIASLFIGVGLYELFSMNTKYGFMPRQFLVLGMLAGMAIPFLNLYDPKSFTEITIFFTGLIFVLFLIQFTRKENNNAVSFISFVLFGVFYVGGLFYIL